MSQICVPIPPIDQTQTIDVDVVIDGAKQRVQYRVETLEWPTDATSRVEALRAFIAALVVGLIDTMGRSFLDGLLKLFMSDQNAETAAPALSAMLIYILMAVILAFRPQGLFPPNVR